MASPPPRPTGSQATARQREEVRYLVFDCGLRPNGLEPAQLDSIFLNDNKCQDFLHSFAIRKQLGPTVFWALIAELNDERTSDERTQLASPATVSSPAAPHACASPSDRTADRRILQTRGDTITTPNSNHLDEGARNRKRAQNVVAGGQGKADEGCSDTAGEPGPKRQKQASSTAANVSRTFPARSCPDSYSPDEKHLPCGKQFKYQAHWAKHWDECHRDDFKLDTPIGKKKYHCIPGCLDKFERAASLKDHQFEKHAMILGATTLSSNTAARFETTNSHEVPSTRKAFAGASSQLPSSFQPSHGNQSQPGPHYSDCDTPSDDSDDKRGSYPGVRMATFLDNSTSYGYLHDVSLVPATTLPGASNGTTQARSGVTPAPAAFNSTYDHNIDFPQGLHIDPQTFLGFDPNDNISYATGIDAHGVEHRAEPLARA